jgi:hypothetical protein
MVFSINFLNSSMSQPQAATSSASLKKGMQLGGKPKTSGFLEAIKQNEGITETAGPQTLLSPQAQSSEVSPISRVAAGPYVF